MYHSDMVEPTDETQPGLGPTKRKLNKKVLIGAVIAGLVVAGTKHWPQYADIFDGLRQALGF